MNIFILFYFVIIYNIYYFYFFILFQILIIYLFKRIPPSTFSLFSGGTFGPKAISTICRVTFVMFLSFGSDDADTVLSRGGARGEAWGDGCGDGWMLGCGGEGDAGDGGDVQEGEDWGNCRGDSLFREMRMDSSHTNSNFIASASLGLNDCSLLTSSWVKLS